MASVILDSQKSQTYCQPSNNISNKIYKTHLRVNINNKEDNSVQKNEANNRNDDISSIFKLYHQNIKGLREKINEFIVPIHSMAPHLICLTEHNYTIKPCINGVSDHDAQLVTLKNYSLPTSRNEPT